MKVSTLKFGFSSGLLGFVLTAGIIQPTLASSFSDVPSSHPYAEAILYVQAQGIVNGYPDGTYRPDQFINRAEFTKIVMGVVARQPDVARTFIQKNDCIAETESYLRANGKAVFSDVDFYAWYGVYVCQAWHHNVVQGDKDAQGKAVGRFRPNDQVNFVEAAKILVQTFDIYRDHFPEDPWYRGWVENLANAKAIPSSIHGFNASITRGEMAEMIYRLHASITTKPSLTYKDLQNNENSTPSAEITQMQVGKIKDFKPSNSLVLGEIDLGNNADENAFINAHIWASDDGKTYTYIRSVAGGKAMVTNGKEGVHYTHIDRFSVQMINGNVAYAAQRSTPNGELGVIVVNGKEFLKSSLTASEAYHDGNTSALSMSSNGAHFAFRASRKKTQEEMLEGLDLPPECKKTILSANDCLKLFGQSMNSLPIEEVYTLVIDGKSGEEYEGVSDVIFSKDGNSYVYAAQRKNDNYKWYFYKNGAIVREVSSTCTSIDYSFETQTLLCRGAANRSSVFHGMNSEEKPYLQTQTPYLDKNGLIYVYDKQEGYENYIVNGKVLPSFVKVQAITVSPDSKHAAFAIGIKPRPGEFLYTYAMTYDGINAGKEYSQVAPPIFSPDGKKFAYIASIGNDVFLVVRNVSSESVEHERKIDGTFAGAFAFTVDGSIQFAVVKDKTLWLMTGESDNH